LIASSDKYPGYAQYILARAVRALTFGGIHDNVWAASVGLILLYTLVALQISALVATALSVLKRSLAGNVVKQLA
jgi:hypothetical protein